VGHGQHPSITPQQQHPHPPPQQQPQQQQQQHPQQQHPQQQQQHHNSTSTTNVVEVSKICELNTGLKNLFLGDAIVPHYDLKYQHVLELSTLLEPPFSVGCWLLWPPTAGKDSLIVLFSSCKNEKVKDWVVVERTTGLIGMIDKDNEIGTDFKPVTKVRSPICSFLCNAHSDMVGFEPVS
jgi:hypothetical protein